MESGVACDGLASWQKRVERYMKDNLARSIGLKKLASEVKLKPWSQHVRLIRFDCYFVPVKLPPDSGASPKPEDSIAVDLSWLVRLQSSALSSCEPTLRRRRYSRGEQPKTLLNAVVKALSDS
jgi:hypothetical protein